MSIENFWDGFEFSFGPFRFGLDALGDNIRYRRNETSHTIRISIDPAIIKEQIKARLLEPGILEVEWPRRKLGGDIPVD